MEKSQYSPNWDSGELTLLKKRLMRRVYFIWFMQKVLVPAFVVLPLGGYLLFTKIAEQNVGVLLDNALFRLSHFDLAGFFNYFVSAIRYTETDSLLIGMASLLVAAFFALRLLRDFSGMLGRNPLAFISPLRWRR